MRRIGGLPEERCTSDAFCSNIKLKKASIFAIHELQRHDAPGTLLNACNVPAASCWRNNMMTVSCKVREARKGNQCVEQSTFTEVPSRVRQNCFLSFASFADFA